MQYDILCIPMNIKLCGSAQQQTPIEKLVLLVNEF